jgi:hypothetical protein
MILRNKRKLYSPVSLRTNSYSPRWRYLFSRKEEVIPSVSFLLVSYLFTRIYIGSIRPEDLADSERVIAFHERLPFQSRILFPAITHFFSLILPFAERHIIFYVTFLIVAASCFLFSKLVRAFTNDGTSLFWGLAILYPMAWNYKEFGMFFYQSDIGAVLLFIAGLLFLQRDKIAWYYATFIFASLNRETSIFLTACYVAIFLTRLPRSKITIHVVTQVVIWLIVRVVCSTLFAANGGMPFEWKLDVNWNSALQVLSGSKLYLDRLLFLFGGLHLILPFTWKRQPPEMRRLLFVLILIVVSLLPVGVFFEARIFNEAMVLMTLAVVTWSIRVMSSQILDPQFRSIEI